MGYFTKQFDDYRLNFPLDDGEGESEKEILEKTLQLMMLIIITKQEILGKTENSENISNILRNGLKQSNDMSYDRLFQRCEEAYPSCASILESGNCQEVFKLCVFCPVIDQLVIGANFTAKRRR